MRTTIINGQMICHGDEVRHATKGTGIVEVFNDNSRQHTGEVHWGNGTANDHLDDVADQLTVLS